MLYPTFKCPDKTIRSDRNNSELEENDCDSQPPKKKIALSTEANGVNGSESSSSVEKCDLVEQVIECQPPKTLPFEKKDVPALDLDSESKVGEL